MFDEETQKYKWVDSDPADYHPGRGVYRSSYKNAMRLAITEINSAYRRAEWESYQQNPLIKGYRIELSNNHTTLKKGVAVPLHDICDELKGEYPKSFLWEGWHPHCRCRMIPIFITRQEMKDRMIARRDGKLDEWKPENEVKKVPDAFTEWVSDNADRIEQAKQRGTLPYFLKDNKEYVEAAREAPTTKVKTEEEKADIRRRWEERNAIMRPFENEALNNKSVELKLDIKQGEAMTFEAANELRGNPNYAQGNEYKVNCQSCVVANELRRRGFDVAAQPNFKIIDSVPYKLSRDTNLAWIDPNTGKIPQKQFINGKYISNTVQIKTKTPKMMVEELDKITKDAGRYHIDFVWKEQPPSGHIITLERLENGEFHLYDPQNGKRNEIKEYLKDIRIGHGINVLRIDNLLINTDLIGGAVAKI
jgi:hypothetical protein